MKKFLFALFLFALAGSAEAQVKCYGAGCNYFTLNSGGNVTLLSGSFVFPAGSVTVPSFSFTGGTTHFYFNGGLAYSSGTTQLWRHTSNAHIIYRDDAQISFGTASDATLARPAAGIFSVTGATNGSTGLRLLSGFSGTADYGNVQEAVTLGTGAPTTDTVATLLPSGAAIDGVTVRVTTTVTGGTISSLSIGDATTAGRFCTGVALVAGTTATCLLHLDQTGAAGPIQAAAAAVRITAVGGGNPSAGAVRVQVHYRKFAPPAS